MFKNHINYMLRYNSQLSELKHCKCNFIQFSVLLLFLINFNIILLRLSNFYHLKLSIAGVVDMYNSSEKNMIHIKNEWDKMIKGLPIDENNVSKIVSDSWQRSLKAGVDPYVTDERLLMSQDEIEQLYNSKKFIIQEDIENILEEIAVKLQLSISIFSNKTKIIKAYGKEKKEKYVAYDSSENVIGTNSICLALIHDAPIQILGEEHFNQKLKRHNCSAAPFHGSQGEIIGVINIGSLVIYKQTLETLGLVTSLAKTIENNIQINNMVNQLNASNTILNKIIEYNQSGIIYKIDENNLKYNRSLLNLLEIKEISNEQIVVEKIEEVLSQINDYNMNSEIEHTEMVLNVNNKKKSYMVSIREILNSDNESIGHLYKFEDTNKILRISYKSNNAIYRFKDIIAQDEEMIKIKEVAKRAARTSSAILINGESGTGKELFAQSIHNESFRNNKPFIAINCGAIPSELIESELFGYEPGAFTGASKNIKFGKLEMASGGTFFFDEIDSMPLNVQVKLLRALSSNRITRIGGVEEIPIDIRIIAATKKDLLQEVEYGNFREDLYFRINIITINIPPLRERKGDIPLIAKSFIKYFEDHMGLQEHEVEPEFFDALTYYYWRGNVRELRNVIEKIILLNDNKKLSIKDLPPKIIDAYKFKSLKEKVTSKVIDMNVNKNILQMGEEIIIEIVLDEVNWNFTKAAKRLGLSRPTLYKKVNECPKLNKRKKNLQLK